MLPHDAAFDRSGAPGAEPLDFSADPELVRVVTEAHRLTYGHLYNPAFATELSQIEPLPHQRIAVYEHLLPQSRIRFLLADDPGAGKTIMSGLLIRELLMRRLVRRVLIVPPAGLVPNWKRELIALFNLPFSIVSGGDARTGNPFTGDESDLRIVSVDTLAGKRMFERLTEPSVEPYDIVFFDEAHKLSAHRNADMSVEKTDRYCLAEALAGVPSDDARWSLPWSCRHVVLLTATPHMGREYPFYALFRLLDPEVFSSMEAWTAFPRAARARYFLRRTKEEMVYYDGRRIYPTRISDTLPCPMSPAEQELYERTTDYIRTCYNKARILNRSAARLAMTVFQRRLTSSTWALLKSFERRERKLDQLITDIETGRVLETDIAAQQRRLSARLPDPIDEKTADEEDGEENEEVGNHALGGFVASSLSELRVERQVVKSLLALAREVDDSHEDSKFEKLREHLADTRFRDEKILIFTEHKDTLEYLVRELGKIGYGGKIAQIHGGMPSGEEADIERLATRQDHVELFRRPAEQGGAMVMVCTDAAAEGINLQFCFRMVNYDIPWNPARLEQRMGRIHRFGQKHDPVYIANLVMDPDRTREGRVLATLLDKLEKIRRELGPDKVFDVIGRLLDGKSLASYMADLLERGKESTSTGEVDALMTKERVVAISQAERERYGGGDEVARELPKLKEEIAREERLRVLPGYVRRFVEKATPFLDVAVEGDPDQVFSLRPRRRYALDPLLPIMEVYPPEKRNRFSVRKPEESLHAVFLHPGEPVFDRLQVWVTSRFERDALRGGVFVDAHASEPYGFHLARVTVVRRADPSLRALRRPEVVESRLLGIKQNSHVEACPVEHLLLLRGARGVPEGARREAAELAAQVNEPVRYAREAAHRLAQEHRRRVVADLVERQDQVKAGFDYEDIELNNRRHRIKDKQGAGDPDVERELVRIQSRRKQLHLRRRETLAVLEREPELFDVGEVELLAHALVVPSSDPADKRRQDAEVERAAMDLVRLHEEAAGARVVDVHTPELARAAGLTDFPGFDFLSLRPGEDRHIEVKGRARTGEIELTENEWARAATLREKYWLYVVFDCATSRPRLRAVRDPFAKLLLRARGGVVVAADEILRHNELPEEVAMAGSRKSGAGSGEPKEGREDLDRLLALIEKWQAEPGDYDERAAAVIDPAIAERRLSLRILDWDWEDDGE